MVSRHHSGFQSFVLSIHLSIFPRRLPSPLLSSPAALPLSSIAGPLTLVSSPCLSPLINLQTSTIRTTTIPVRPCFFPNALCAPHYHLHLHPRFPPVTSHRAMSLNTQACRSDLSPADHTTSLNGLPVRSLLRHSVSSSS